jgi:hypothetical protein
LHNDIEQSSQPFVVVDESLKIKNVTYSLHNFDSGFIEAVLARGDRKLSAVLEKAWEKGSKLDGWDECYSLERWMQAFEECGIDPAFYANRVPEKDEILPWDHIFSGVTKSYLWSEYQNGLNGQATPDCKAGCRGCGALSLTGGGKCDV